MLRKAIAKNYLALIIGLTLLAYPLASRATDVPKQVLKAADSVVFIESGIGSNAAVGSGFIIYKEKTGSYIATNSHVIENADSSLFVWVNDTSREPAKIVVRNIAQDLAIIYVDIEMDAPPLVLSAEAKKGDEAYAIGFPVGADALSSSIAHIGSEATITSGIVSSIRESNIINDSISVKILQINVDINSGNSGGPLLNRNGEVIGINAFGVIGAQGINGAISSKELIALVNNNNLFEIPKENTLLINIILCATSLIIFAIVLWIVLKVKRHISKKTMTLPEYMSSITTPIDCYAAVSFLMPLAQYLKGKHDAGSVSLRIFPAGIVVTREGCSLIENKDIPTERFISPEHSRGELAGIQSDVYSFTAVLKYVLENWIQEQGENDSSSTVLEMRRILEKGLAESQKKRYHSMQELINDIAPFNLGISAEYLKPLVEPRVRIKSQKKSLSTSNPSSLTIEETVDVDRAKRKKRKTVILCCIAGIVFFIASISMFSLFSRKVALEKMDAFEFKQAVIIFDRIPLSNVLFPQEQMYINAGRHVINHEYDKALADFRELGNYRKAETAIYETYYQEGLFYLSTGKYSEASKLFLSINSYDDSEEKEQYSRYLWADDLLTQSAYDKALNILYTLIDEGYEPSKSLFFETSEQKARMLANKDYFGAAYKTLLEAEEYGDATAQLSVYRNQAYQTGVSQYRDGKYSEAKAQLCDVGDFLDAESYLFLIEIHLTRIVVDTAKLKGLIGFEDSAALLVFNQDITRKFMLGTWRGDGHYFKMGNDGSISYDLPYFHYGDYYKVEDGVVLLFPAKNESATKKLFKISVIDEDCITVLAYQNHKTYTLYRE